LCFEIWRTWEVFSDIMPGLRRNLLLAALLGVVLALMLGGQMPWSERVSDAPLARDASRVQPYDPLR